VPIGRVTWFAGTKGNSYDNFAWYRFDARHSAGPIFHGNGATPGSSRVSLCAQCTKRYQPQRSDSIGAEVRQTMQKEGATLPENLPIEPPIAEVRKRLAAETPAAIAATPIDPATES
jgi:hypothetical protein